MQYYWIHKFCLMMLATIALRYAIAQYQNLLFIE